MPTIFRVPSQYSAIRDEIVAHAVGEGPEPIGSGELEDFQNWLIYESPAAGNLDFEYVIRLSHLAFEDDQQTSEQSNLDREYMKQDDPVELPDELVPIRDAVVASAHGGGPLPKGADELFNWLIWQADGMDFDYAYFSLERLNLYDDEARAELELTEDEQLSDEQRLEYARRKVERTCRDNDIDFAHAYRIESQDGRSTYLCGVSWIAGQGGPDTNCVGTYPSKEASLSTFEDRGWSNESANTISMETVLKHWKR